MDDTPRRTAVFLISLSQQRFTTAKLTPALAPLQSVYSNLLFLVADQIQLYNRAAALSSPLDLASILSAAANKAETALYERRKWLDRLRSTFSEIPNRPSWTVVGGAHFADQEFVAILRNVAVLYAIDADFARDVDRSATDHDIKVGASSIGKQNASLSVMYLLEEVALNLRIHIGSGIFDEYYIGAHIPALIKLYAGCYSVNVYSLTQKDVERNVEYRFFECVDSGGALQWRQVSLDPV